MGVDFATCMLSERKAGPVLALGNIRPFLFLFVSFNFEMD